MPLGTFTVTIDGNQLGAGTETSAEIVVKFSDGRQFVRDTDEGAFWFPHLSNEERQPVSLPYDLVLVTDVETGESETIGYEVTAFTRGKRRVIAGPFPAQAAGSTVALTAVTSDFAGQVSESLALRAETAAAEAAAAAAAAEAVGATNDAITEGLITDSGSATSAALAATVASGIEGEVAPGGTIAEAVDDQLLADRADWRYSRGVDVMTTPRFDDRPTVAWANTHTTTLTGAPVTYYPQGVNGGSVVSSWDGQSDPNFAFFGGYYETANGANGDFTLRGKVKPDATTAYRWPIAFSFITSAVDTVEIMVYGAASLQALMIEVNGRLLSDTMMWRPASFAGTSTTVKLTFPTALARQIRVWTQGGLQFRGVRVPEGGTISKPANGLRTIAMIGDSYVNGAGESRNFPNQGAGTCETFAPRLGLMMGGDNLILAGIGGSGWLAAGEGSKYRNRVDEVLALNPDVVVFYGSTNDGQTPDTAALQAEVEATLALCAAVPEVYVIGALRNGWQANAAAVRAGTEAAGRPYIDLDGFLFGAGKVTAPVGDGNNDFFRMDDGAHPTLDAHRAIARKAFAQIAGLLAPA